MFRTRHKWKVNRKSRRDWKPKAHGRRELLEWSSWISAGKKIMPTSHKICINMHVLYSGWLTRLIHFESVCQLKTLLKICRRIKCLFVWSMFTLTVVVFMYEHKYLFSSLWYRAHRHSFYLTCCMRFIDIL